MRLCLTGRYGSVTELLGCRALARAMALPARPLLELRGDLLWPTGFGGAADRAALRAIVMRFGPDRLLLAARRRQPADAVVRLPSAQSAADRQALWRWGHALGVAWLDVDAPDWLADAALRRALAAASPTGRPVRVLVSQHLWQGMPSLPALWRLYARARASGAQAVKIAAQAHGTRDLLPMLALLRRLDAADAAAVPLVPVAMGPVGKALRLLAVRQRRPPPWTYVCPTAAQATAAGQWSLETLPAALLRGRLGTGAGAYAVIGSPLGHSRSPLLHNRLLEQLGRPALYVPQEVPAHEAVDFLRHVAPRLGLAGLSVTLPHKQAVAEVCRARTWLTQAAGACNTLWAPKRRVVAGLSQVTYLGDNTDGPALLQSLRRAYGRPLAGARALVLGSGGTARLAALALRQARVEVALWGRNGARAAAICQQVGAQWVAPPALRQALPYAHILVHATPVGMAPDLDAALLSAAALARLPRSALVMDCIYQPAKTKLLQLAAAQNLATLGGRAMFLGQAGRQAARFYGVRLPLPALAQLAGWARRPTGAPRR